MVNSQLVTYVKQLLAGGYDPQAIQANLLQAGYAQADIDAALAAAGGTGRISPLQRRSVKIGLGVGGGLLVVGLILAVFLIFSGPRFLVDIRLDPLLFEVERGESFEFTRELVNLGSASDFDVSLQYSVLDPRTNAVVQSSRESLSLQARSSQKQEVPIPGDVRPGRYVLKAQATYGKARSEASTAFKVKEAQVFSCSDGVQNQGELGIDCGGPCAPCSQEEVTGELTGGSCGDCDDFDICTQDTCVQGQCSYAPISPCCGDFICAGTETSVTCPEDCAVSSEPVKTASQIIDEAVGQAGSDANGAGGLCGSLAKVDDSDDCYTRVAQASDDYSFCGEVGDDTARDECYMDFALRKNQFEVCAELTNRYLKNSCFSLKNLRQLQALRAQA